MLYYPWEGVRLQKPLFGRVQGRFGACLVGAVDFFMFNMFIRSCLKESSKDIGICRSLDAFLELNKSYMPEIRYLKYRDLAFKKNLVQLGLC